MLEQQIEQYQDKIEGLQKEITDKVREKMRKNLFRTTNMLNFTMKTQIYRIYWLKKEEPRRGNQETRGVLRPPFSSQN